jgi:hypothetical protein
MKANAHIYVPQGDRADVEALAEVLRRQGKSLSGLTVEFWRELVERERKAVDSLRSERK